MNTLDVESLASGLKRWGNFNSAILFLVKAICTTAAWPYGEIWIPDNKKEYLIWSGFWGRNEEYFEKFSKFSSFHKFSKGVGLIGKTWEQSNLISLEDVSDENNFLRISISQLRGFNSAISIPILNNNEVICILCFFLKELSPDDKKNAELLFRYTETLGKALVSLESTIPKPLM